LISDPVLDKIIEAAKLSEDDIVLEIGCGIGTLTRRLAWRCSKVIGVELDQRLFKVLSSELKEHKNVKLINANILELDLTEFLPPKKIIVVANLPYYITTPIILFLLDRRENFKRIVVMVQLEVAKRMVASPGGKEYGAFSIRVQYFSHPSIISRVSKNSFIPPPKVDSAVVKLEIPNHPIQVVENEDFFFDLVRVSFSNRRKMLKNALVSLNLEEEVILKTLEELKIDPRERPETLSVERFSLLSNLLYAKRRGDRDGSSQ
jgi:16S rRNA (adenine1518-N6/adenine1519-N6)-dimethyltransferase